MDEGSKRNVRLYAQYDGTPFLPAEIPRGISKYTQAWYSGVE
jgi:hypothetical protein